MLPWAEAGAKGKNLEQKLEPAASKSPRVLAELKQPALSRGLPAAGAQDRSSL